MLKKKPEVIGARSGCVGKLRSLGLKPWSSSFSKSWINYWSIKWGIHLNDLYGSFLGLKILSSVQFSHSVVSDSLRPHESQHARPPCPSPSPGVHSNSRLSSQWCHPGISSSVVPFSSCPQSLPAPKSFPMSQLFAWSGQRSSVWDKTLTGFSFLFL